MIARVLAFVLLLGSGLALLTWLESRDSFVPMLAPDAPSADGGARLPIGTISIWDRQEFASYGPDGGLKSRLVAEDALSTVNGEQVLIDVKIDMFESESGTTTARITSERAVVELNQSVDQIIPEPSDTIRMQAVVVDVRSGSRLAPLQLTTPSLVVNSANQRFQTVDRVVATSNDVDLEGEGCLFDLNAGRLVFTRDAEATVTAGDGRTARLHSRDALEVLRPPGVGTRPVTVVARGRARLGLSGDEGLALEANEVELEGMGDPDREGTFRFTDLVARGEVVLLARGNRFQCREARFVMSPDGAFGSVRLSGAIEGELDPTTADVAGIDDAALAAANGQRVSLWGRGPMDLRLGTDRGFDLAGPAELAWEDTRLWAEGGLRGVPGSAGRPLSFEAWSGVRVERDAWVVRTEQLEGRWLPESADAPAVIELEALTLATATGQDRDGSMVQLRAREGFALELTGKTWKVTRAIGVDLETGGRRPLTASADRVDDFTVDPVLGPMLSANEHVQVTVDGQFLRGQELTVKGLDDLVVKSSDGPVLLDGPGLHAEAREVRRVGDRVVAVGGASAHLERPGLELDLVAERIEVTGSIDAPADAPLRLRAIGGVNANVVEQDGAERMTIATQDLEVVRQPVPGGDQVQTTVRAREGVVATVVGRVGDHDLVARELDALVIGTPFVRSESADGAASPEAAPERRGSVEARGAVEVESRAPTVILGKGDTFSIDHQGRGTLVADPGRKVSANGTLPGGGQPFDVVGSSIEFDPTSMSIVEPRIEVKDPMRTGDGSGGETPAIIELVATCRRLEATEVSVVFDGDVSFLGTTPALESWTLRCARAELFTEVVPPKPGAEAEGGSKTSTRRRPRELVATGDVRVVFSEGLRAEGDTMTARAFDQRVRVEGTPARLRETGLDFVATYFDIDTVNALWEAGPFYVGPSSLGGEPSKKP
ncbi:hypothetical protein Pla163_00110 [Planctomycetes bacterium Pla163]|uniref:Uncharacterized protein n=1 Tax=Rohdeia mirabilis TaxID=2528008 RepID=A0A518CUL7_9BACT|nr:hypothetical protein Pla163_00110 [Planctomycetes bacterium Pla163]